MSKNIFEQIRDGEAQATIVYKDDYVTAFNDLYPDTPVHVLIIPNKLIKSMDDIEEEDSIYLSKILLAANKIAKQLNISESGYRLITNCKKDGGQEIDYLHFHLVGGCRLGKMLSLPKESKKIMKNLKEKNLNQDKQ